MIHELAFKLNRSPIWRQPVHLWGKTLVPCSADRLLALWLHRLKWMGKAERITFSHLIRPGMTVADVGANQGIYSLYFSELAGPQGNVYSFEPEPLLFDSLQKNCDRNEVTNVKCFRFGLGESEGAANLNPGLLNSGDNRIALSKTIGSLSVPIRRMDAVLEGVKLDFVKIDVQGYELSVLKGMDGLIQASPGMLIYFEYWPFGLRQAGTDPAELLAFFHERGFQLTVPGQETGSPKDFEALLESKAYLNLLASRVK